MSIFEIFTAAGKAEREKLDKSDNTPRFLIKRENWPEWFEGYIYQTPCWSYEKSDAEPIEADKLAATLKALEANHPCAILKT